MVNKLKSKAELELLAEIANSEEVIEFKKIEKLVLENKELKDKIERMFEAQKQAINARELDLENAYYIYKKEYEEIHSSLKEDVLFNQYLALKSDAKNVMNTVINIIEKEIEYKINE